MTTTTTSAAPSAARRQKREPNKAKLAYGILAAVLIGAGAFCLYKFITTDDTKPVLLEDIPEEGEEGPAATTAEGGAKISMLEEVDGELGDEEEERRKRKGKGKEATSSDTTTAPTVGEAGAAEKKEVDLAD